MAMLKRLPKTTADGSARHQSRKELGINQIDSAYQLSNCAKTSGKSPQETPASGRGAGGASLADDDTALENALQPSNNAILPCDGVSGRDSGSSSRGSNARGGNGKEIGGNCRNASGSENGTREIPSSASSRQQRSSERGSLRQATKRPEAARKQSSGHVRPALEHDSVAPRSFERWLALLWATIALLTVSGAFAAFPIVARGMSDVVQLLMAVLAVLAFVPYLPLSKVLDVRIDAFLLEYDHERSPSLIYYAEITKVFVAWLLLGLKFLLLDATRTTVQASSSGCEQESNIQLERNELGQIVLITAILMSLGAACFARCDSLRKLVCLYSASPAPKHVSNRGCSRSSSPGSIHSGAL
mmetsp:Transcript_52574/g.87252  ORF Transcript_52574/g.87252 Transcript_52574/m.87252 type:complete len:358 (-) Transcript_52574:101-1174(-)